MDMSPQFSWLSELDMNDLLSLLDDDLPDMNSLDEFLRHGGGGVTFMEDNNDHNLQAAVNHHPSFSSSVESTSNSTTAANQPPSTTTTATTKVCLPPMILNFGSASMSPSKDDLEYVSPLKRDRAQEEVLFADDQQAVDVAIINNNNNNKKKKTNQTPAANQKPSTINKPTSHTRDHIMAERRRREKINERFIALSALVPALKRADKASVLGEAIKYVKQLQERINVLEKEENSRKIGVEAFRIGKKWPTLKSEEDNNNNGGRKQKHSPEIEARLCDKKSLLLKIQCERRQSVLVQILSAIEKLGCSITSVHATSFGYETLDITIIAQMEKEMDMIKPEHIVKDLSLVFTSV